MLLKFKGKVIWVAPFFFFFLSFFQGKKKVSTHLKVVLLQKSKSLEEVRKEGEGMWEGICRERGKR